MRILNVGDFNWMTGRERDTANVDLFAIRSKLTNAAIRANHQVLEFSDRAVARMSNPFRSRGIGRAAANRAFLQLVDETRPELLLLNFADDLENASLREARKLARSLVIVDINIDPLPDPKTRARLLGRREAVDAVFVTTAGPELGAFAPARGFAAFLPNPVDPAVETGRAFELGRAFEREHEAGGPTYDLIVPLGDDSPRQVGDERLRPSACIGRVRDALPGARIHTPGLGSPRLRGIAYFDALARSRAGWALSRYNDQPLYASDRMAHMLGCGLPTALDARAGFDRIYEPGEALFYRDLGELTCGLRRLYADEALRVEMARRGWERTWRVFEVGRVFAYLLDQLFREGGAHAREWPVDRWSG